MADNNNTWWLARIAKYDDRNRGVPRLLSTHTFVWDRTNKAFALEDDFGLGPLTKNRLPVPVELAEAFLLRCQDDPIFHHRFLAQDISKETAEETFEVDGHKFSVERGTSRKVGRETLLPGLTFRLIDEEPVQFLYLTPEFRKLFGDYIVAVSPAQIRQWLRAP